MPDLSFAQTRPQEWVNELGMLHELTKSCFPSRTTWSMAGSYVVGLLSGAERKNAWQLAEELGESTPYAIQHLLGRAIWDAECVRDAVRGYVYEHLGHPLGVHVLDETGFLKKGDQSVGVKRQYCGTAGKTENCQVGVFLAYASPKGAALVDRMVYLPEDWAGDPERRKKAKVPESVEFATKSQQGLEMLKRAFEAGAPAGWVTGDEAYGKSTELRRWLESHGHPYVLAVASNVMAWRDEHFKVQSVADVLVKVKKRDWKRLSAGAGEKGERWYDWAALRVPSTAVRSWSRWVLFRRRISDGEIAFYRVNAPTQTPLEEMVRVAGARWAIETCFEQAKGEVGLDQYEVRSWHGWHRHMTLSMLALAYLAVMRHQEAPQATEKGGFPSKRAIRSRMARYKRGQARQNLLWTEKRCRSSG